MGLHPNIFVEIFTIHSQCEWIRLKVPPNKRDLDAQGKRGRAFAEKARAQQSGSNQVIFKSNFVVNDPKS